MNQNISSQKGNAVMFVLIAIALFTALLFAITNRSKDSSQIGDAERAKLYATEIVAYANSIKIVIEQLRMLKGVSDLNNDNYGVLFSYPKAHAEYGDYGDQPETEIFNPNGGKVEYQIPDSRACIDASSCVYEFTGQINISDIGNDFKSELSMAVLGLKEKVCSQINKINGHEWNYIPQGAELILQRFSGENYGELSAVEIKLSGTLNELKGQQSFCYQESNGLRRYVFVHIINAR